MSDRARKANDAERKWRELRAEMRAERLTVSNTRAYDSGATSKGPRRDNDRPHGHGKVDFP
jgi:serine/threonine protein kinase HipA of HipAB toxin-antitoxin module